MDDAQSYTDLFKTGQYGRLYIRSSQARGGMFHIYVLPANCIIDNFTNALSRLKDVIVEVYGVIFGAPGVSATYGWLHEGKWQDDFADLVKQKRKELWEEMEAEKRATLEKEQQEVARRMKLLEDYTKETNQEVLN